MSDAYTDVVKVYINSKASAASNSPLCGGGPLELTNGPDSILSCSWEGPDGFTSTDQSPTQTGATLAMSGMYTLTVVDGNGLTDTERDEVTVAGACTATADDFAICEREEITESLWQADTRCRGPECCAIISIDDS